jgi:hypothetical protein
MKKIISLVMAVLMIFGTFAFTATASFDDILVDNEALYDAVELLDTLGVAKGTTDTTFSPNELVTRQQMAAFTYRLMKAGRSAEGGVNTTQFTDLVDSTYFNMISWANNAGIIKGISATEFNPTGNITLQDAYVMLVRALGYENDEALVYPHGYIDTAESIGLDENISTTIGYTDSLTRGDIAILLYNAFYADMNEKTVEYEWVVNPEDASHSAYAPIEKAETIAHKIFGVTEETFVVLGTKHYTVDGYKGAFANDLDDVDRVVGVNVKIDAGKPVITEKEITMEDLGLDGCSDEYFLSVITLFVKADDEIIAAKSNLVKKTVTADDVVIDRSTKNDDEYYVGGKKTAKAEKVMTGLIDFDGIKTYLDETQAPYSVIKDGYVEPTFITLKSMSYNDGDPTFVFAVTDTAFAYDEANPSAMTFDFANAYPNIYNGGLYEADIYDADGDTYADCIFVKDYEFAQIVNKKNNNIAINDKNLGKEVVVIGDYESEDYALMYINGNYIEIKEVIDSFDSKVISKSKSDDSIKVVFENGVIVELLNDKYLNGVNDFVPGKVYTVYVKDDIALYSPNSYDYANFNVNDNYAIIIPNDEGKIIYEHTDVIDNEIKTDKYVTIITDKGEKLVRVSDYVIVDKTSVKITEDIMNDFINKFSSYTINSDGEYVFTKLTFEGVEAFADVNEEKAVYVESAESAMSHFTGSIYAATNFIDRFNVKDYSKIIIKSYDEEEEEDVYTVYTNKNLPAFETTMFKNVKAIMINNTKSAIENVGIMYAEIDGEFGAKTTKDYKIVLEVVEVIDENGKPTTKLAVLDIATGKTANGVILATGAEISVDEYVTINSDGKANKAITADSYSENMIFVNNAIVEYDADNGFLSVGDNYTYIVDDDTVILLYEDNKNYELVEDDILNSETWEEDETYTIDIIAIDDKDNAEIKIVKTIVVR